MGFYLDQNGNYYEGDKADWRDTEVTQRPDYRYIWNKEWVLNDELIAEENKTEALKKLENIDKESVRSIREYLTGDTATKTKALEYLTIHETKAQEERAKMGLSIDASVVEKS